MIPAPPTPAMARPTISTVEEDAVAQTIEPASKMAIVARYTYFMSSSANNLPIGSWNEHMVSRYADPYQPTSFTELNSDVIAGVAIATMDRS